MVYFIPNGQLGFIYPRLGRSLNGLNSHGLHNTIFISDGYTHIWCLLKRYSEPFQNPIQELKRPKTSIPTDNLLSVLKVSLILNLLISRQWWTKRMIGNDGILFLIDWSGLANNCGCTVPPFVNTHFRLVVICRPRLYNPSIHPMLESKGYAPYGSCAC